MKTNRNIRDHVTARAIAITLVILCAATAFSETLFFVAQNPQLIPGSPQRFQYEVWIRASEAGHRVGSVIIYNNYNTAVFGTGAAGAGRITITKNSAVFGATYGQNPVNDNTGSRFAFSWTYLGTAGSGVEVTNSILGMLAFTVQITVTGNPSSSSGIAFQDALMTGEQFKDDELTPWPSNQGISFIENGPLPVQLASFTGVFVNGGVRLNWRTLSEINNYGFYVQRRMNGVLEWWSIENAFVAGHGTTNEPQNYSFTDNAAPQGNLQYRLKQVDLDGAIHFTEPINVSSPTSVNGFEVAPKEFSLKQNYPNPFNPSTTIKFALPENSYVSLAVYDMIGRKVAVLENGMKGAGYHSATWNASDVASGVYFAWFIATDASGNVRLSKVSKLLLAK